MTEFASRISSIREDYPDAAYYSAMNLLDSHDTVRLLWALTPGNATTADKEGNSVNLSTGKQMQKIASLLQFTLPGAPTIYYGDEVGMTGDTDPDDRRTFPGRTMAAHPTWTCLPIINCLLICGLRPRRWSTATCTSCLPMMPINWWLTVARQAAMPPSW